MNKYSSKERAWFDILEPAKVAAILISEGWQKRDKNTLPAFLAENIVLELERESHHLVVVPKVYGDWKTRMAELINLVAEVEDWSRFETLQYLATGRRMVEVDLAFDYWERLPGSDPKTSVWAIAEVATAFHSGSVFKGVIYCDRGELNDLRAANKAKLEAKFYVSEAKQS